MNYDLKALDKALDARIKEKKLPGVSCAIYGPDGVIFEKGYGFGNNEHTKLIDENTIFGIASMSKSTSTLALAILEAEGKFSYDDPVTKYIPSFRIPGNPTDTVLVRHLAMHTAGIPPMEPLEWSIAMNSTDRFSDASEETVGKDVYSAADESDSWALQMRRTSPNQMDKIEQVIDYIANCKYKTLGAAGEYMSYSNEGYAVISYIVDAAAGMPLLRPAARALGAQGAMLEDCVRYGGILLPATGVFMLQNVFQSFFIAAEKPRLGLFVTVAAGITNMVLDALFIAVFDWGVAGAAIATGLSQCVGGVLPLIYFLRPNTSLLRLRPAALRLRPILQSCGNGSSELMSNISSSLVGMLYNFQLMRLIGEDGVSAYGVLMYVQFIFVAIFIGYSIGSAPVVSFHYGAQHHSELKNLLRKSALLMAIGGVTLTVLARVLAAPLSRLFVGYDASLYALTTHAFRLFCWSFLLAGFNIFASGFFTALNNGAVSAAISFLRTLVFQAGSVVVLPILLGVDGIWWAITSAEIFAFIISGVFLVLKRNKYHYM